MKTILILCAIILALATAATISGCSGDTAPVQPTLIAIDGTGSLLPTTVTDGVTWFVGGVDQPLHFAVASRSGLAPGETTVDVIEWNGSIYNGVAVDYSVDTLDPMVVRVHKSGTYKVFMYVGVAGGGTSVLGSCWLKIDVRPAGLPNLVMTFGQEQLPDTADFCPQMLLTVRVKNTGVATGQNVHLKLTHPAWTFTAYWPSNDPAIDPHVTNWVSLPQGYGVTKDIKIDGQHGMGWEGWSDLLGGDDGLPIGDIAPGETRTIKIVLQHPGMGFTASD